MVRHTHIHAKTDGTDFLPLTADPGWNELCIQRNMCLTEPSLPKHDSNFQKFPLTVFMIFSH